MQDIGQALVVLQIAVSLLTVGSLIWAASAVVQKAKTTAESMDKLSVQLEKLNDRVDVHEVQLAVMRERLHSLLRGTKNEERSTI